MFCASGGRIVYFTRDEYEYQLKRVRRFLEEARQLIGQYGITGLGIGIVDGRLGIIVFIASKIFEQDALSQIRRIVPPDIPVKTVVSVFRSF